MDYRKILKTLALIRKDRNAQQAPVEHSSGAEGFYEGKTVAPRSFNTHGQKVEHHTEAAPELGIELPDVESLTKRPEDVTEETPPDSDSADESGGDHKTGADKTLDQEIADLLEADRALDGGLPSFDDIDFIRDISVFDTERQSPPEAMPQNDRTFKGGADEKDAAQKDGRLIDRQIKQLKKPLPLIGILAACLFLTAGMIFFLQRRFMLNEYPNPDQAILTVKTPDNAVNGASYVFFDDKAGFLADMNVRLKKMAYGRLSSVFYFDNDIDVNNYRFELEDLNGKKYTRDMTMRGFADGVIFQPFDEGIKGFALKISEAGGNKTGVWQFEVKDKKMMPARYVNKPVDISLKGDGGIFLDSAVFANTGANLQIRIPNHTDNNISVTQDTSVEMFDGAHEVLFREPANGLYMGGSAPRPGAAPAAMEFRDRKMILSRADFDPVRGLDDKITIRIKGLNGVFYPRMDVESADLFDFAEKGAKTIPFEPLNLVIEGMQRQGDVIALVMHGEDAAGQNRVQVKAGVDLHAKDSTYKDLTIHGECKYGPRGTDVLFNIGDLPFINLDPRLMRVEIISIEYALDDINAALDLSELDSEPLPERAAARLAVENSFPSPAQMDLIYFEDGGLIGSVLETPDGADTGAPTIHLVSAENSGDQWVIRLDGAIRTEEMAARS